MQKSAHWSQLVDAQYDRYTVAGGPFPATNRSEERAFPREPQTRENRMANQDTGTAALEVWPRAVMATLLLLITLLTAHLVQVTWFDDAAIAASPSQHDLAQQP